MKNAVKPIPEGYHTITPYLIIRDAAKALEFYKKAFGATVVMCMEGQPGKIAHAEIKIGNSMLMLAEEAPERDARGPQSFGGSPVGLHLYVDDVDQFFNRAIAAGAVTVQPVQDQFYGDRSGMLTDPFGHAWSIGTHKENLSPEEIAQRMEGMKKHHHHDGCC